MQYIYIKNNNHHFDIQIDNNLGLCMAQEISHKKSDLGSETLKCDIFKYLVNQYK